MLVDKLRSNVVVYGPYTRKDNRKHVVIYWSAEDRRQTVSYPKWLMEQHLGRILSVDETVDHINRNFRDDRIENFKILNRAVHTSLDNKRVLPSDCVCVYCGKEAQKVTRDRRGNAKQGKAGPFCSRSCAGKYGAELQNGRIDKLPVQEAPESIYYKIDKG